MFFRALKRCGSCIVIFMKKILIVMSLSLFFACHGNENAENKPTDQDRTRNNDTSAVLKDSLALVKKDSTDTTHH